MRVTILGRSYKLEFCKLKEFGLCDDPNVPRRKIRINSTLSGEEKLETLIHEMLHASDWSKDEAWIDEAAKDISRILWKLGYREMES